MKLNQDITFAWRKNEDGAALVRVYTDIPEIEIPETIEGLPVTEIGSYCFSGTERLPKEKIRLYSETVVYDGTKSGQTAACGAFPERIVLPHSVRTIGSYAFYGCVRLHELTLTEAAKEIGSDAFLNCAVLNRLILRCGSERPTGLKQLLAQISWNVEVIFEDRTGKETAKLFFPEYSEVYAEIGPAHIFELKLTGEGFRARQCFRDGVLLMGDYDAVFPQACIEESEQVLIRMAADRLSRPVSLSDTAKKLYQEYIKDNQLAVVRAFVKERETEMLQYLITERLIGQETLEEAVRLASELGWAEGTVRLMRWKDEYLKENLTNRYHFEDF